MFLFYLLLLIGAALAAKPRHHRCTEGETMPHEVFMNKFYKCVNRRWTLEMCQINYTFDSVIGYCVFDRPAPPSNKICNPFSRTADKFDNTRYFQCSHDGTQYFERSCPQGSIFVQSESRCVALPRPTTTRYPPTRTTTRPPYTPPTTPQYYGPCVESAGRDGYKADIYHCDKFYQCASGIWTQRSCGQGTIWNQHILTCDHNRGQCRPYTHPTPPPYTPGWPTHPPWPPVRPQTPRDPNSFKK